MARRVAALVAAFVILLSVAAIVRAPSLPARAPRPPGPYGPAIAADTLANTQIGGTSCGCPNLATSFRFRAPRPATLLAVRVYLIVDRSGYSGGTGGSVVATIEEDDGTVRHDPSGVPIARAAVTLTTFPLVSFPAPTTLLAGRLYHVVFRNADPSPTANFVSINSLFVDPPVSPRQPTRSDTDWAQLIDYGRGWSVRPEYTPILELVLGDGTTSGIGYMESWVSAAKAITGTTRVRERFVVTGGDVRATSIFVRLARTAGSGAIIAQLEAENGAVIARAEAPAFSVPLTTRDAESGSGWVRMTLADPVILADSRAFQLVLSTDAQTEYRIHGLRKGVAVGFGPGSYFADGVAEVDSGNGWVALDPGWRGPLPEADLQFYLE